MRHSGNLEESFVENFVEKFGPIHKSNLCKNFKLELSVTLKVAFKIVNLFIWIKDAQLNGWVSNYSTFESFVV